MFDTQGSATWIALVIGNTRLHWGLFEQQALIEVRHTPHLANVDDIQALLSSGFCCRDQQQPASMWVASAVPEQTALCRRATSETTISCRVVERSHIPLAGLYPTLGLDRAINLLGAKDRIGWPVLVIDAGTALTFTAGRQQGSRAAAYGGAILPGMRLQMDALGSGTAALKNAARYAYQAIKSTELEQKGIQQTHLPKRWATDTKGAIASGLIYGAIAIITDTLTDWWQRFPAGKAVLTGGDGPQLHHFLAQKTPEIASRVSLDSELMFYGMSAYRQSVLKSALKR